MNLLKYQLSTPDTVEFTNGPHIGRQLLRVGPREVVHDGDDVASILQRRHDFSVNPVLAFLLLVLHTAVQGVWCQDEQEIVRLWRKGKRILYSMCICCRMFRFINLLFLPIVFFFLLLLLFFISYKKKKNCYHRAMILCPCVRKKTVQFIQNTRQVVRTPISTTQNQGNWRQH